MSARLHSHSRHSRRTVPTYEFRGIVIRVYRYKERFSAHFKDGLEVHRFERGTEHAAVEAAKQAIRKLSDVEVQIAQREESTAAGILKETGISVIEAARSIVTYSAKLTPFGASLADAVEYYVKGHQCTPISVSALVDSLLRDKESTAGDKHVRDLKYRLKNRFCRDFGSRSIQGIQSDELSRWINGLNCSARNKRNYHAAIVTLSEHGRENGFLPKDRPTEIQLVKKKKAGAIRIDIFTPADLNGLIQFGLSTHSPALSALLIQALAGVRHEEIEQSDPKKDRLRHGDILLKQKFPEIHIRPEVSKTGRERYVPVVPALAAWLRRLHQPGNEPVYARLSLYKDYRRICRAAGVPWKRNGLRKSFATYDSALSGSANLTAKSAGNSAEMVRRYYRKEVRQVGVLALEWLSTGPEKFRAELVKYIAHLKAFPPKALGPRKRRAPLVDLLSPMEHHHSPQE